MIRGTLYVKVDGDDVPVAPCTIEVRDGGVFAYHEGSADKRGNVTWHRIGTLPVETMDKINNDRRAA